ncbi:MAG: YqjF family protein [Pirellula sp.]
MAADLYSKHDALESGNTAEFKIDRQVVMMEFLSAHWKHLVLANYIVEPKLLEPFVPAKTKLDFFQGACYVSLVAFLFDRTRVLGIPVPLHRKFEEVNLRFYVVPDRDPSLRAVTFIREIVPRIAIPLIANTLFNENYVATRMSHRYEPAQGNEAGVDQAEYCWGKRLEHRVVAKMDRKLELPPSGSLGEFITEHYWGYAKGPRRTLEYRVKHPQWVSCLVDDYQIDVDFASVYGKQFGFLKDTRPANVLYALGSPVTVSFPGSL